MSLDSNHVTKQQSAGAPATWNSTQPLPALYKLRPLGYGAPGVPSTDPSAQGVFAPPLDPNLKEPKVFLPTPAASTIGSSTSGSPTIANGTKV